MGGMRQKKSDREEREFNQVKRLKESLSFFCLDLLFAHKMLKPDAIQCTGQDGQVYSTISTTEE